MAIVTTAKKACAVNPLKMSQPIGGAFAFLGLRGAMPPMCGSQQPTPDTWRTTEAGLQVRPPQLH